MPTPVPSLAIVLCDASYLRMIDTIYVLMSLSFTEKGGNNILY